MIVGFHTKMANKSIQTNNNLEQIKATLLKSITKTSTEKDPNYSKLKREKKRKEKKRRVIFDQKEGG